ncbi:MAG: iron-containing alcohol dehydrogenase family protein [Armatimonadota bacterium]
MEFSFTSVNKIIFGPGKISDIGSVTAEYGSRVLLVTGKRFLRASGYLDRICESLTSSRVDLVVFDDVPPEPSLDTVERGIALCRQNACDSVIAVGGGSVIDVGKAIAILVGRTGSVHDYFHGSAIDNKGLPFIAVPTTAGSGSEVTPNSVLIDPITKIKASIRGPFMHPDIAIVDPELTLTMSPKVTAHSGMDALSQSIEAYVSLGANPVTDALAQSSVSLLVNNLCSAFHDGSNITYRTDVALGSLIGGMAFSNARLGLIHGMAHPLGVISGMPHGLVCALLLPIVMQFNMPVSICKYADLSRSSGTADTGADNESSARDLINRVEWMNGEMGITGWIRRLKPDELYWEDIIDQTLASGSTKSNPVMVTREDIIGILKSL